MTANAAITAKFLYQHIAMTFGPSKTLYTDQRQYFQNVLIARLTEFLRTCHFFTTAYYPEANRIVEH